jgi:hypothetical protein
VITSLTNYIKEIGNFAQELFSVVSQQTTNIRNLTRGYLTLILTNAESFEAKYMKMFQDIEITIFSNYV